MPTVSGLQFTWEQPDESKLNEGLGADDNRATAWVKIRPGTPANRRLAYTALHEYPIYTRLLGPPTFAVYVRRNIPLAYSSGIFTSPDAGEAFLYLNKFTSGHGSGPDGEDTSAVPLPEYQVYGYEAEFTDRSYDILPDSAVPGPVALIGPAGGGSPVLAAMPLIVAPSPSSLYTTASGPYYYWVTAVDSDGESLPSNRITVATVVTGTAPVLTWSAVTGALGYRVYGSTFAAGPVFCLGTVTAPTLFFVSCIPPAGAYGPSQVLPGANTTGSPIAGFPDEGAALGAANGSVGGRYVTRNSEADSRTFQVPSGLFQYRSYGGPKGIPEALIITEERVNLTYTHHMVPRSAVPNQAIIQAENCVNLYPFDGFPAGTLLVKNVKKRYYRSALGGRVVDLQYPMIFNPHIDRFGHPLGWNSHFGYLGGAGDQLGGTTLPNTVDYVALNSDPNFNGQAPFRSFPFAALFRPDQI